MLKGNSAAARLLHLMVALALLGLVACSEDVGPDVSLDVTDTGSSDAAVDGDATPDVGPDVPVTPDGLPPSDTADVPSPDVVMVDISDDGVGPAPDAVDSIGEPVGELVTITHAMVKAAIDAHLEAHIDGLDASLQFLETSDGLNNLIELLFEDDDDDEGEEGGEDVIPAEEEPTFDIDLSEMPDDLSEWLADYVLVESTATLDESGTTLTYLFTPEFFCASEEEEGEISEEEQAEKLEEEAECAEQITASPLRLVATSDGDDRIHLTVTAGQDDTEVFRMQLHGDMIAIWIELAGVKAWLQTFIDEEDFEFPDTMTGTVGVEIRQHGLLNYEVRFAIEEAIQLVPAQGQDSIALAMDADPAPGGLVLDGAAGTITGDLAMTQITAGLPWQMMVDMMWDDEGHDEWVCKPNGSGGEDCGDEWVDGPESPPVEGMMNVVVPGPTAGIEVDIATDTFGFVNLSLGGDTLAVDVDGENILQLDLNAQDGGVLALSMVGEDPNTTRFEMTPQLDVEVGFAMDGVKDGLQDPPEFMLGDTLGVRMDGHATPSMKLVRLADKFDVMVSAGQLTLWSGLMDDDVVVGAGQCLDHDDEGLTDEEKDALHGLFGGLYASVCGGE